MKAIMYHYVRPDDARVPYFRHLHLDDFIQQLDYFEKEYGFVSKENFEQSFVTGKPSNGIILTFDDGIKDHHRFVAPELVKRNLWGIFYVPTLPYEQDSLLDVHRIHMLIGRYGGEAIAQQLRALIEPHMLTHAHIDEFRTATYTRQNNSEAVNYVKRVLNYYIDYRYRKTIINQLMNENFQDEKALRDDFYMNKEELRELDAQGMVLGSHTVNHPVMSKLSRSEQENEIVASFAVLESIVGAAQPKTFCYPHGGFHTFTDETELLLEKHSCLFSFNVEARDIGKGDLLNRRQALPRYDCNAFPHGACRYI